MAVTYGTNTLAVENQLARNVVINKIDKNKIIRNWANTDYNTEGTLREQGQTVVVPVMPRLRGTRGGTAGADITENTATIDKESFTVDQIIQDNRIVGRYEEVVGSFDLISQIASEQAYAIDQAAENHAAVTAVRGANSSNVLNEDSPVTLTAGNVFSNVVSMRNALGKQDVRGRETALFCDPATIGFMIQSDIFDASDRGLTARTKPLTDANGYMGTVLGMMVYETNNVPFKQKLTLDTNPTADDTVTVTVFDIEAGSDTTVTFTWKASPSAAGEVDIGADAAASQANLIAAINGSGVGDGTDYVELSAANRGLLNEYEVELSAFDSDVAYVTANRQITLGETFTAASNVFGTASFAIFAMDRKALNFVEQLNAYKMTEAENGFRVKSLYEFIYQGKVFSEPGKGIAVNHVTIQ